MPKTPAPTTPPGQRPRPGGPPKPAPSNAAAAAELDRLTVAMAENPAVVDVYSEALERFVALGGDDFDARAATVGADVGLPADRLDVAVSDLSGGQAARAGLAAVLLARFDV